MIKTENRTIDEIEVQVAQWPARRTLKNKIKILNIIGPALGKIGSLLDGDSDTSILDSDISMLCGMIEEITMKLEENKFDKFIEMIFSQTWFNNKQFSWDVFDDIFTDNLLPVYKTIGFVLEVNYKSFFAKSGIGKKIKDKLQTISQNKQSEN